MCLSGVYEKALPRTALASRGDVAMGVTLERVQFKFASIIGELCNEPKILSQFAVWLDMRLAEFKLRGSITLGKYVILHHWQLWAVCQYMY